MADFPDHLDPGRHRDVPGWTELATRRAFLGLLTLVAVLALLGAFGQRPGSSRAASDRATLEVSAPERLRGGLFLQGRFTVVAAAPVRDAVLVLDRGWLESMHINTIEPAPAEEASRDGRLALSFGPLAEGDRLVAYMQFQVNPTNVGRRPAGVELFDGETSLARVDRTVTVFP